MKKKNRKRKLRYPCTFSFEMFDKVFTVSSPEDLINKCKELGVFKDGVRFYLKVGIFGYVETPINQESTTETFTKCLLKALYSAQEPVN